jgi:hypothetical protein
MRYKPVLWILLLSSCASSGSAQDVVPSTAATDSLVVSAAPDKHVTFTSGDLAKMPRTMISATEHNKEHKYEGVLLRDLLVKVGAPLGTQLKGVNMAAYVYFTAKDGYHSVLALAEIEPAFQQNDILVADTENGKPLAAEQGPFRLIVPEDHKPARWIRMLQRIDVRIAEVPNNAVAP